MALKIFINYQTSEFQNYFYMFYERRVDDILELIRAN
jgi:hypothetical protein